MSSSKWIHGFIAGAVLLGFTGMAQADFIDKWVNGLWNETTDGLRRGIGVEYLPRGPESGFLFLAYYTYAEDTGEPFWVTGLGEVEAGDFSTTMTLRLVEGGSFGALPGTPSTTDPEWGTATVTFHSCDRMTFEWTSPNVQDGSSEWEPDINLTTGTTDSICVYEQEFAGCPDFAITGADPRTCVIPGGEYTEDLHLTNDTLWVLNGAVFIGTKDNADNTNALFIEPGTRIIGIEESLLGILRGAKIYAEGVPHAPIVMTGANTASNSETPGSSGDWGGMTINGKAPINTCDTIGQCTADGEGESGPYGGDDENDSSGVLRYVRVQFAGFKYSDINELNGIAFQGVGRGTVVENVQVHANQDDGVEFFGGTVNARNLVLTEIEDDSLDWTQGWRGRVQNVLVVQYSGDDRDVDNGIEADNLDLDNDAEPRAKPWIANATFIGNGGENGAKFREGTGAKVTNSIFTGFGTCIDIDHTATYTNAGTPGSLTGNLTMENTILNCTTPFVEADEGGEPWTVQSWFEAQNGNQVTDPMLEGVFPPMSADYTTGYPLDLESFDAFFQNYDHIGAFSGAKQAWTHGWTLDDY